MNEQKYSVRTSKDGFVFTTDFRGTIDEVKAYLESNGLRINKFRRLYGRNGRHTTMTQRKAMGF